MRSGEPWRIAHTLALIAQGFLSALREADDRAALQDELEHAVNAALAPEAPGSG